MQSNPRTSLWQRGLLKRMHSNTSRIHIHLGESRSIICLDRWMRMLAWYLERPHLQGLRLCWQSLPLPYSHVSRRQDEIFLCTILKGCSGSWGTTEDGLRHGEMSYSSVLFAENMLVGGGRIKILTGARNCSARAWWRGSDFTWWSSVLRKLLRRPGRVRSKQKGVFAEYCWTRRNQSQRTLLENQGEDWSHCYIQPVKQTALTIASGDEETTAPKKSAPPRKDWEKVLKHEPCYCSPSKSKGK